MNQELLLECFMRLSADKAAGIDEVTKDEYFENLEAYINNLVGRMHRMAYRPQPVRRVYIPKPGNRGRQAVQIAISVSRVFSSLPKLYHDDID